MLSFSNLFRRLLLLIIFISQSLGTSPVAASTSPACGQQHVIERGDTLSHLARTALGSVFAFPIIHEQNIDIIGPDPHFIRAGDEIFLPCPMAAGTGIDWTVLPQPHAVAALQREMPIQILDIRSEVDVKGGVLPGSIWIPFDRLRGPAENPGQPPAAADLANTIGKAGLRLDQPTLIVHSKPTPFDTGRAAYVYWMLKSAGADQLAILRGGIPAWEKAGLAMAPLPNTASPYDASVAYRDTWRADKLDIYAIATGQREGALLDARPHSIFKRLDRFGKPKASTLLGAQNSPVQSTMELLSGYVSAADGVEAVLDHLKSQDIGWTHGPVVSFCSTGELGALNWFYASELANIPDVQLYPESTRGWIASGGILTPAEP